MSAKPAKRNWNDVQTAIATAAIVTTLGMWNLFAKPAKTAAAQEPPSPTDPPTDAPTESPVASEPTSMPYVKVIFTPGAPQIQPTSAAQQSQQQAPKKRKRRNNGGGGSGGSSGSGGGSAPAAPVAQTKSS